MLNIRKNVVTSSLLLTFALGACSDDGSAGAPGPTGPSGEMGAPGVTGATGATGTAGSMGTPGVTGTAGTMGTMGLPGPAGPTGATGATGESGAPGATGAAGDPGATGPTGPAGTVEATVAPRFGDGYSVARNANVVFNSITYSSGNISYNSATGVITFNAEGRYLVSWNAAIDGIADLPDPHTASDYEAYVQFALSSSQGDFIDSGMPTVYGQVSGQGIIDVAVAPVTLSLVSTSPENLNFSTANSTSAQLVVTDTTSETSAAASTHRNRIALMIQRN